VYHIDRVAGRATYTQASLYSASPGMVNAPKGSQLRHPGREDSPRSNVSHSPRKSRPRKRGEALAATSKAAVDPLLGLRWLHGEGGLTPLPGSVVDSDSEGEVDTHLQHAPISRGKMKGRRHGCLCDAGMIDAACESLYVRQGAVWGRQHARWCLAVHEAAAVRQTELLARQQEAHGAAHVYERTWGDQAEGRKWQLGGAQERRRRGSVSMTHGAGIPPYTPHAPSTWRVLPPLSSLLPGPGGQMGLLAHSHHWVDETAATKIQSLYRGRRVRRGSQVWHPPPPCSALLTPIPTVL